MTLSVSTLIHVVLLVGFFKISAVLLVVALINRMRVRDALMTWHTGPIWGVSLWPMLYLGVVAATAIASLLGFTSLHIGFLIGYAISGVFWLVAAQIYTSTIITERGIIRNVNRAKETMAWGQVVDYCEQRANGEQHYVFFYLDEAGKRRRFQLPVPKRNRSTLRALVERKIDARFAFEMERHYANKLL